MTFGLSFAFRSRRPGHVPLSALLAAVLLAGSGLGASAQVPSITIGPPPGSGLPGDSVPGSPTQDRGPPPNFRQYTLTQRLFGTGGAIFPGYVDASTTNGGRNQISFVTGGGDGGRLVFAAGTVDRLCQMTQAPNITVLTPPQGVTLNIALGSFVARRVDAGSTYCLGRTVGGMRVTYSGTPPRGGTTARLRVAYPPSVRSYTHVINIPAR